MSRASKDRRPMSATEMALVGPEVEVVAKASRRRFTMEYKRKIVREADGGKTPGAGGGVGDLGPRLGPPPAGAALGAPRPPSSPRRGPQTPPPRRGRPPRALSAG